VGIHRILLRTGYYRIWNCTGIPKADEALSEEAGEKRQIIARKEGYESNLLFCYKIISKLFQKCDKIIEKNLYKISYYDINIVSKL
jgi:hypothetical protein